MRETVADIGEKKLLDRIFRILGPEPKDMLVSNGDDAAVLPSRGRLVISTDASVENVHYYADRTPPESVAWKALAGALSDLAAKAADPYAVLITLALPITTRVAWIERLYEVFAERGKAWNAPVVGGDLVRSSSVLIDVVALGWLRTETPVTFNGAKPGDAILVTGQVGAARLGLFSMEGLAPEGVDAHTLDVAKNRFLRPEPRIEASKAITDRVNVTAMTDVSDGLARDLPKMADASGVGFQVSLDALPTIAKGDTMKAEAWRGGEDYELLFTVDAKDADRLLNEWKEPVPIHRIGTIVPKEEGQTVEGLPEDVSGFDHFTA